MIDILIVHQVVTAVLSVVLAWLVLVAVVRSIALVAFVNHRFYPLSPSTHTLRR